MSRDDRDASAEIQYCLRATLRRNGARANSHLPLIVRYCSTTQRSSDFMASGFFGSILTSLQLMGHPLYLHQQEVEAST